MCIEFVADPANNGLYRYSKRRGVERLPGSYKTSNAMTFDYKLNIYYIMDGCDKIIRAFKLNKKTGKLCKKISFDIFRFNRIESYSKSIQYYFRRTMGCIF